MNTVAYGVASFVTFLLAAKAHGRELRLEREAAGIFRVVFGGDNPPIVEAIWSAERWRFWVAMPLLSITLAVALLIARASRSTVAFASLLWSPSLVLLVLGLLSIFRGGGSERAGLAGSVGWWSLVVVGFAVVAVLGRRAGF
jgi:hypothetical protein